MDILTLSLAVQKALRELGVKTEPGKVLLKETTASYGVVAEYIGLAVGKTYNVSFLGGTFQTVCKAMEEIRYVGNLSLLIEDAENTGEAFCIAEVVEDGENGTVWSFSVEGEEFTVSTPETIHPIDPKFLPGVCLPVVELETEIEISTNDAVMKSLTDADALALQTALASDANEYILRLKYKSTKGNLAPVSVIARKNIDENSSGLFFFLGWHIGAVGIADGEIYYITQLAHGF